MAPLLFSKDKPGAWCCCLVYSFISFGVALAMSLVLGLGVSDDYGGEREPRYDPSTLLNEGAETNILLPSRKGSLRRGYLLVSSTTSTASVKLAQLKGQSCLATDLRVAFLECTCLYM